MGLHRQLSLYPSGNGTTSPASFEKTLESPHKASQSPAKHVLGASKVTPPSSPSLAPIRRRSSSCDLLALREPIEEFPLFVPGQEAAEEPEAVVVEEQRVALTPIHLLIQTSSLDTTTLLTLRAPLEDFPIDSIPVDNGESWSTKFEDPTILASLRAPLEEFSVPAEAEAGVHWTNTWLD